MIINRIEPTQFPFLLKQIPKPPEFLYCAGALPPSNEYKYLCVIGARNHSQYGQDACDKLIAGLRDYPIVIISGLALGIDSIAHRAALKNGLRTIAFPGSGLSQKVLYPHRHIGLSERIVESGNTLLSPFEMDQEGALWTFPARNRLMAGISHATLIIEGKKGSGTLLTANYALDFNREVLIVPGSIFEDLSYGPHLLYRGGATPVTTSEEILDVLGFTAKTGTDHHQQQMELSKLTLSQEEAVIIRHLRFSPYDASALMEKTSFQASVINITLSQLEMRGLIVQEGSRYRVNRL